MNYYKIDHTDMLNGDGIRVVLWVSGCSMHCHNCQNPQTWDKNSGIEFDESAMSELLMALEPDYISGLTLTGGHPFEEYNIDTVCNIIKTVKEKYPNKTIWVYTGYEFEEILNIPKIYDILHLVDIIVDGKYDESKRDLTLKFIGSSNQRLIDINKSLRKGCIVLYE